MDEDRARRVTDALRDRGIAAHLRKSGIDAYSVQVPAGQGREAVWGAEGTTGLEAEVLLDGDLVGFVPQIPGSENFDEAQIVDAIARADYDQPEGRERAEAPPEGAPLAHEGGVFRRFIDGFRYDSELSGAGGTVVLAVGGYRGAVGDVERELGQGAAAPAARMA
jgi:hypothetical protein